MPKSASEGIANHVSRLVDNTYDLRDVAEVVRVRHSLALAILRAKSRAARYENAQMALPNWICGA